jgi:hypothetical protein
MTVSAIKDDRVRLFDLKLLRPWHARCVSMTVERGRYT